MSPSWAVFLATALVPVLTSGGFEDFVEAKREPSRISALVAKDPRSREPAFHGPPWLDNTDCEGNPQQGCNTPLGSCSKTKGKGVWCSIARFLYEALADPPPTPMVIDLDRHNQIEMKELIKLFDTNDNNEVDFDEFLSFSETNLTDLVFNHFDFDTDGKISQKEAVNGIQSVEFKLIEELIWLLYSVADLNGDGELSIGDVPRRERRHLDRDRDGVITLKDLLGKPIVFYPGPVQVLYKSIDPDQNMKITRTEMTNFVKFLSKFFNVLDVNSDCSVSFDEALSGFNEAGMDKEYQLAMEIVARPFIALGRYIVLTFLGDADKDQDSQLSVEEIFGLTDESGGGYGPSRTSPYYYKYVEIIEDVLRSLRGPHASFLEGRGRSRGRDYSYDRGNTNHALNTWLETFQGFLAQPTFQELKSECF